jgi:hypothetical protein
MDLFEETRGGRPWNLQARDGKAKPYQVKQVRKVILKYVLRLGE